MKRVTIIVMAIGIAAMVMGAADAFNATCADTFKKTAAGSTKDARCNIKCGTIGVLPAEPGGIKFYANQTANGAELEACSDTGPGNQHGRLVTQIDASQGTRIVLDSDQDQSVGTNPGYEIVQAGLGANPSGMFCNSPSTTVGADGYERPWNSPGSTEGPDCPRQIVGI